MCRSGRLLSHWGAMAALIVYERMCVVWVSIQLSCQLSFLMWRGFLSFWSQSTYKTEIQIRFHREQNVSSVKPNNNWVSYSLRSSRWSLKYECHRPTAEASHSFVCRVDWIQWRNIQIVLRSSTCGELYTVSVIAYQIRSCWMSRPVSKDTN